MGRQIKRVPLDFDYPLNKVWDGYLNPHHRECPHCVDGTTPARARLSDIVSLLTLSADDARRRQNHPYFTMINQAIRRRFQSVPSTDLESLIQGLSGGDRGTLGYSSSDYAIEKKIIEAAGLNPDDWGICIFCKGDDIDPEVKEAYEAWVKVDPPAGDGYQLWENTTEGSPQSPVFASPILLADWCEKNETIFAENKQSKEDWLAMINQDNFSFKVGNVIFL